MATNLLLSIPTQRAIPQGILRDDSRKLDAWLHRLARLSATARADELSRVLHTMNRVALAPRRRMLLLDQIRPAVAEALDEAPGAGASPASRLTVARELAFGFKAVVADLFVRDAGGGTARNAHALQRALWAMGILARESMAAPADTPERLWRECHSLYECAVQIGAAERTVDDALAAEGVAASASGEYRRVVLLGLVATTLSPERSQDIWDYLARACTLARMIRSDSVSSRANFFAIDARAESPGQYQQSVNADGDNSGIDTSPLVRSLARKLASASGNTSADNSLPFPLDTARQLLVAWSGGVDPRSDAPSPQQQARSPARVRPGADDSHDLNRPSIPAKVNRRGYKPARPETHTLVIGLDAVLAALDASADSAAGQSRLGGHVENEGQHGATVVVNAALVDGPDAGVPLLCRTIQGPNATWLGIVRRVVRNADSGEARIGVQILSKRPRLTRIASDDQAVRPAVLIDGNPDTGRPPTLLAAADSFAAGRKLRAQVGNRAVHLQATEILEHTGAVDWFSCRRLPTARTHRAD